MGNDRYEALAKEIRLALDAGASQLEGIAFRAIVIDLVKHSDISCEVPVEDLEPWELIKALGQCIIWTWPNQFSLTTFAPIEHQLSSLRKIRETLNNPKLNEWVAIFPDQTRMEEPRVPLPKFRDELWKTVLETRI